MRRCVDQLPLPVLSQTLQSVSQSRAEDWKVTSIQAYKKTILTTYTYIYNKDELFKDFQRNFS